MLNSFLEKLVDSPNPRKFHVMVNLFKHAIKSDQVDHQKYSKYFTSPEMYARTIQFGFLEFIDIMRSYYNVDTYFTQDVIKNNQILTILKTFVFNGLKFVESTINSQEDNDQVLLFTIKALGKLQYILPLFDVLSIYIIKNLQKKGFTLLVQLFSFNLQISVKLQSFLEIRKLFNQVPEFKQQLILKKLYKAYELFVKHVTWRNFESITFMINCITELFGFNMDQSYVILYNNIKTLVQIMHQNQEDKNDANVRKVYSQQTLFILKLWVKIVEQYNSKEQLGDLIYPLIQAIQGLLQFQPSVEYYPLALHLNDYLIRIATRNNLKIQLGCLSLMNCAELKRHKKKTGSKAYDFEIGIQLKPKYKQSGEFWSDFCGKLIDQIVVYYSMQSRSLSFPEETILLEKELRGLEKQLGFDGNKIRVKKLIKMILKQRIEILKWRNGNKHPITQLKLIEKEFKKYQKTIPENEFESQSQRILYEREQENKQRVLAEKERIEKDQGEDDISSEQQEIEDERDTNFVYDEIKKERTDKRRAQIEQDEFDGELDFEGDPEDEGQDEDYLSQE